MAGPLHVDLVAADRRVWSGDAQIVITRTTEGDIGILPGHQPVLGILVSAPVTIRAAEGEEIKAAVQGGFLSVAGDTVSILAEFAELAEEIDVAQAEAELAQAGDDVEAARRAETRLRAAGAR